MSILIKGAKMPEGCDGCICSYEDDEVLMCPLLGESVDYFVETGEGRHPLCPLVEIPPHGDLIDRDKFMDVLGHEFHDKEPRSIDVLLRLGFAPTAIESEGE